MFFSFKFFMLLVVCLVNSVFAWAGNETNDSFHIVDYFFVLVVFKQNLE